MPAATIDPPSETGRLPNDTAICDLRSDTVTRPDAGMRAAMVNAEVGDDVYGDDPSVQALEAYGANLLGKEQAAFFPSGTQSNLAAVLAHCQRGEEIILGANYHILAHEAAGASVLGGIAIHPVPVQTNGSITPEDIRAAIKPDDSHAPISRLVGLENTVRGQAVPLAAMHSASDTAREAGLSVHLDGARILNAATALSVKPAELADTADTVSMCLSKGLGAPAGTLLVGPPDVVARARRWRKMLGGGMRQSGVLAAAGLYALEHNAGRLSEDHDRAGRLAAHLNDLEAGDPNTPVRTSTNMVFFTPRETEHPSLRAAMADQGILLGGSGSGTIRIVLHKDVNDEKLDRVCTAFTAFYKKHHS